MFKKLLFFIFLTLVSSLFSQQKTYQHLIMYGQSYSSGYQSYPPISTTSESGNYMIGDQVWIEQGNTDKTKFNPLVGNVAAITSGIDYQSAKTQTLAETPILGIANHLQKMGKLKGKAAVNYLASADGEGGKSIEQLSKIVPANNKNYYKDYFLKSLEAASEITINEGSKISSPAIFWMQGESNYQIINIIPSEKGTNDKNGYLNLLIGLKNDMQSDIVKQYKQEKNPVFITYQTTSMERDTDDVSIGNAQIEASNTYSDIICAGPTYQMPHRGIHLDPNGNRWYGEMFAKVYYQTQIEGKDFKPLQPKKIYRISSNKIGVEFLVPKGPLVFDTDMLPEVENYGFKVKLNGEKQIISAIEINDNNVIITSEADLNGEVDVNYGNAVVDYYKVGNLRDSDDYTSFYEYLDLDEKDDTENYIYPRINDESLRPKDVNGGKPVVPYNEKYPLYNFSVAFEYGLSANQNEVMMPGFFSQDIIYVKKDANGDGSSWSSPMGELADAVKLANQQNLGEIQNIKQIWVAKGSYTPKYRADNLKGVNPFDRDNSFVLPRNVEIYGGFSGSETAVNQRNWKNNITILSGDIKGDDGINFSNTVDNAYHVIISSGDVGSTLLDGFTITSGNASYTNWTSLLVNGRNTFKNSGGAMYVGGSSPKMNNLIITNNQAYFSGGAIRLDGTGPDLVNTIISNNKVNNTALGGGGIYNNKGSITLTNALLFGNQSSGKGGAIFNEAAENTTLINVTISENKSITDNGGGGIYSDAKSSTIIKNSIIWGNGKSNVPNLGVYNYNYSLIQGITTDDNNNIDGDTDPLLANITEDNYRLINSSPVINKGNNSYISSSTTDLDGNTRVFNGTVDLGAYESSGILISKTLYVKENATGDGSSWNNALGNLQETINKANTGDEIWVAKGTYKPNRRADDIKTISLNDKNNSFLLKRNVNVFGGFQGTETSLSQREWELYPSILSGNLGGTNTYHVVISAGSMGNAILDGFTITEGKANATDWSAIVVNRANIFKSSGGGIYFSGSSSKLNNLIITNNEAYFSGGGIRLDGSTSKMVNTRISNNKVTNGSFGGAGIYSNKSTIGIANSLLNGNESTGKGGSIFNEGATTTLTNVTSSGNKAVSNGGGGIHSDKASSLQIQNSIIWGNGTSNMSNLGAATYSYSLVGGATTDSDNNINGNTDPLFENAVDNDYRLTIYSSAVDYGNRDYLDDTILLDLNKNTRIINEILDLGAYENQCSYLWNNVVLKERTTNFIEKVAQGIEIDKLPENMSAIYEYEGISPTVYAKTQNLPINAGKYKVTATLTHSSGCEKKFTAVLTINKIPFTGISLAAKTVSYNTKAHSLKVDGELPPNTVVIYEYEGINPTVAKTQNPPINAGIYNVTATLTNQNYEDLKILTTLTIDKIAFTGISLADKIVIYNAGTHSLQTSGELPPNTKVVYEHEGISPTVYTKTQNPPTNAGLYQVTATVINQNYFELKINAKLTIDRAVFTGITLTDKTVTYNGSLQSLTVSGVVPVGTIVTYENNTHTDIGTYPNITAKLVNSNYNDMALASATLIINKANFTGIRLINKEVTYDGRAQSLTVSGDLPVGTVVVYENNTYTNAGIYSNVTAKLSNPNYNDIKLSLATLTINKAQSVITADTSQIFAYDGAVKNIVASLNHTETDLTLSSQGHIEVGEYPITVSSVETANYLSETKLVTLIIELGLGVDDPNAESSKGMKVAPNPATTVLNLIFFKPIKEKSFIKLYDLTGRLLLQQELSRGKLVEEIDIRSLQSGVYILKYENKSVKVYKK